MSVILLLRVEEWILVITFVMCVVQIKTFRVDVRYQQQSTARKQVKQVKNI